MSRYVDAVWYRDEYRGTTLPAGTDVDKLLDDAEYDIDSLTYNRIVARGFGNLTTFQQNIIRRSVCMHADFMFQFGEYVDLPLASYSAGMTSVSLDRNKITEQNGTTTSNKVFNILKQSGLTTRRFI